MNSFPPSCDFPSSLYRAKNSRVNFLWTMLTLTLLLTAVFWFPDLRTLRSEGRWRIEILLHEDLLFNLFRKKWLSLSWGRSINSTFHRNSLPSQVSIVEQRSEIFLFMTLATFWWKWESFSIHFGSDSWRWGGFGEDSRKFESQSKLFLKANKRFRVRLSRSQLKPIVLSDSVKQFSFWLKWISKNRCDAFYLSAPKKPSENAFWTYSSYLNSNHIKLRICFESLNIEHK